MEGIKEVLDVNKVLLTMCIVNSGDWDKIYDCIKDKKVFNDSVIKETASLNTEKYITLVDSNYPVQLKNTHKPPFVVFYRGNYDLLKDTKKKVVVINDNLASNYANETVFDICKGVVDKTVFIIRFGSKKEKELIKTLNDRGADLVVVLNRGLDIVDNEDKELYEKLCNRQLVISEYPNNLTVKTKKTELFSLKLAVSLADCALVGAITKKSPYYASIGFALENNITMMCIPFNAGSNYLNNKMIRNGAELVECENDVIEVLKML